MNTSITYKHRQGFGEKLTLKKRLESYHLGNVLATVLDRKTGASFDGTTPTLGSLYDHWNADLATVTDYYPGGMMMPGRNKEYSWSRMGYNGQAKDDEVYGKGNLNTATFWEMDTRILKRWNLDPIDQISISNYAIFGNNPIVHSDVLGNKIQFTNYGGSGSGSDLFAQQLNKELGKNVFSIGQNGYLQVTNDKELMKNSLYKYFYGKATAPQTVEVEASSVSRPSVFIDSYEDQRIQMDQVSASSVNGFNGAANHMVHFIAEQWSRQIENINKPADYIRDHTKAIDEELAVTGFKLDGKYTNGGDKSATYIHNFIEVKNKSGELVGYYQSVVSFEKDVAPVFRYYDKEAGAKKLEQYQREGTLDKTRISRTDTDTDTGQGTSTSSNPDVIIN